MDNEEPAQQNEEHPNTGSLTPQRIEPVASHTTRANTEQHLEAVEKEMSSFERSTLKWARTAVIMSGLAAAFVCLQWVEMCKGSADTHSLATAAGNQALWTQRLAGSADTESGHMKDLADHMKDQADRTKDLAGEAKAQAEETRIAANAAKSAAETAKDALHVSERAYLTLGVPANDFGNGRLEIPIINSGHVPSGVATIIQHEATFDGNILTGQPIPLSSVIEAHWMPSTYQSIPVVQNGSIYNVEVHFPKLNQTDLDAGKQSILAVVVVSYNDGFPDTPEQKWVFCDVSSFDVEKRHMTMRPCSDYTPFLPIAIAADHYPDPKYEMR